MPFVSVKQLKAETRLSVPTIKAACERAGVPNVAGAFDHDAALAAIRAEVDPARTAGHAVSGLGDLTPTAPVSAYASARARSEEARASKLELDAALRTGRLVERESVTLALTEIVVRVRTALLGIGTRAAPIVIGKTDMLEIADAINAAARDVLEELADDQSLNDAVLG